jgi:imidazolonepropionase
VALNGGAFEMAAARGFLSCAKSLGFRLRVCAGTRLSAVRLALEMAAAAVALEEAGDDEIQALAGSQTVALLTPASGFRRRAERPPARALIEAGATVALASGFGLEDGPTYNMQMVMALASSELGMSTAEAISAATINAAHALGCDAQCGSLEPGKSADLLLLNVEDYRDLTHRFGINHVHMVLKKGTPVYQEGEVLH